MAGDPWVTDEEVAALAADVRRAGADLENHVYPGDAHLFTDPDDPGHDPGAAALVWDRVTTFLARVDAA